jgi:hypothetical protein
MLEKNYEFFKEKSQGPYFVLGRLQTPQGGVHKLLHGPRGRGMKDFVTTVLKLYY